VLRGPGGLWNVGCRAPGSGRSMFGAHSVASAPAHQAHNRNDLVMRRRHSIRSLGQEDARAGSPPESLTGRLVTDCPIYETVSA